MKPVQVKGQRINEEVKNRMGRVDNKKGQTAAKLSQLNRSREQRSDRYQERERVTHRHSDGACTRQRAAFATLLGEAGGKRDDSGGSPSRASGSQAAET